MGLFLHRGRKTGVHHSRCVCDRASHDPGATLVWRRGFWTRCVSSGPLGVSWLGFCCTLEMTCSMQQAGPGSLVLPLWTTVWQCLPLGTGQHPRPSRPSRLPVECSALWERKAGTGQPETHAQGADGDSATSALGCQCPLCTTAFTHGPLQPSPNAPRQPVQAEPG